jgi:acylphosphatase
LSKLDAPSGRGVRGGAFSCRRNVSHGLGNAIQKDRLATAEALLKSRVYWPRVGSVVHEEQNAKRFYVSGMVQGVGYRYFVERAARHLKLTGYVRNLRDGRVEAYAIGAADALSTFRSSLERGPNGSSVTGVIEAAAAIERQFTEKFSIEYDD